jgi:hypothetical protein
MMLTQTMWKRALYVAIGLSLLVAAGWLTATRISAETATVTVSSGSGLTLTTAPINLGGVTLDGTNQTAVSLSPSNTWSLVDSRGTGEGYNVTIEATDFSDGLGNVMNISSTFRQFKVQLTDANILQLAGGVKPTTSVPQLAAIPESGNPPLKILSANVGEGQGSYELHPNFTLDVPANTVAGTYTSTVTVTIATGP